MKKAKKIPPHQIFEYLQSKNFNLTSDKTFRQQHPPHDTAWDILSFLCDELKDQTYSQLQPTLAHMLDREVHAYSLKRMSQYIIVSSVFKKLGYPPLFPFTELFKPDKDKFLLRLYKVIGASKYNQKILKKYDTQLADLRLSKNNIKTAKIREDELEGDIQRLQKEQSLEKQQVQEKEQALDNLGKQIAYKRKEKGDLMTSQQELYYDLKKKKAKCLETELEVKELEQQNNKLKKALVQNAPAIKKERLTINEKLQNMKEEFTKEEDRQKARFYFIEEALNAHENIRQRSFTLKNEESFKVLKENEKKMMRIQRQKQEKVSRKEELMNIQKELKQKILENDKKKSYYAQEIRNKASSAAGSQNVIKKKQEVFNLEQNLKERKKVAAHYFETFKKLLEKKDMVIKGSWQRLNTHKKRLSQIKRQAFDLAHTIFDDFK